MPGPRMARNSMIFLTFILVNGLESREKMEPVDMNPSSRNSSRLSGAPGSQGVCNRSRGLADVLEESLPSVERSVLQQNPLVCCNPPAGAVGQSGLLPIVVQGSVVFLRFSELKVGDKAEVTALKAERVIRRRIMDMGLMTSLMLAGCFGFGKAYGK